MSPSTSPSSTSQSASSQIYKKKKLTTSQDIVNRLKWDTRYPHEQFIIGYMDRFLGMMETTIEAFLDADDTEKIPHHRIYYFKLNNKVVWDREKRRDLISNGRAMKYVKYSDDVKSWIHDSSTTDNSQSAADSSHHQDLIIFNNKKKRHYYQQYKPEDVLEDYMSRKNYRELCLLKPTHISQKGGYYAMDITKYQKVLQKWAASLKKKESFFMEEYRTPVFRLYLDLDFKTTDHTALDMIKEGYLPLIQSFTKKFFLQKIPEKFQKSLQCPVLVTECHGEWEDAVTKSANFKSGYRLYFPTIFVDEAILKEFILQLGEEMKQKVKEYPGQPQDWHWDNVVDLEQASHQRARMFGTVKWRRGRILGRKYKLNGYYLEDSQINKKITNIVMEKIIPLLQLTSVRLENKPKIANSKDVNILVVTSTHVKASTYPLAELKRSHIELAGLNLSEK